MITCEHRFERLKYRIRNNFVNRAKIKIYFRLTTFFDEKDKISIIISKIAQNNIKIEGCTKNTTLNIIKAIKIKNYILNISNCNTKKQIVKIITHRTLSEIKVGKTNRQCIQLLIKIIKISQLDQKLITNCNKLVNQEENIRVRLPKYSIPSHFPRQLSMDKVNYNYCRRIIVTLNLMSKHTTISILRPNTSHQLADWWGEAKYITWTCMETTFLKYKKLPTVKNKFSQSYNYNSHYFSLTNWIWYKNFVKQVKIKIYFRLTLDENDKISIFTFKIVKMAIKLKNFIMNICNWRKQIIKIFPHRTLFEIKVGSLKRKEAFLRCEKNYKLYFTLDYSLRSNMTPTWTMQYASLVAKSKPNEATSKLSVQRMIGLASHAGTQKRMRERDSVRLGNERTETIIEERRGENSGIGQRSGPAFPPQGSSKVAVSPNGARNSASMSDPCHAATLIIGMTNVITPNIKASRARPCSLMFPPPSSASGSSASGLAPQDTSKGGSDTSSLDDEEAAEPTGNSRQDMSSEEAKHINKFLVPRIELTFMIHQKMDKMNQQQHNQLKTLDVTLAELIMNDDNHG